MESGKKTFINWLRHIHAQSLLFSDTDGYRNFILHQRPIFRATEYYPGSNKKSMRNYNK